MLEGLDVREHPPEREGEVAVLEPQLRSDGKVSLPKRVPTPRIDAVRHARRPGLANKAIRHRLHGLGLVGLLFKPQLHGTFLGRLKNERDGGGLPVAALRP
jgi:hypothetical protein